MFLLVAGVFGVLVLYAKEMARRASKEKKKNEVLTQEVEMAERIQNVKTTTTRDAATKRLQSRGSIRKD
jgi:hypothetical protein